MERLQRAEWKRGGRRRSSSLRAYMDTLVLLSNLKSALKQNQLMCKTLEEKLTKWLAETEESHQEVWRGLQEGIIRASGKIQVGALSKVCERWGERSQQGDKEKKELQGMVPRREKIWNCEEAERKNENPVSHIQLGARWLSISLYFCQVCSGDCRQQEVKLKCSDFVFAGQILKERRASVPGIGCQKNKQKYPS